MQVSRSFVLVVRAWQTGDGVLIRLMVTDRGDETVPLTWVTDSPAEACERVRTLLRELARHDERGETNR